MLTSSLTAALVLASGTLLTDESAKVDLTPAKSQERAYAAELLADAGYRESYLAEEPTSGYIKNRFTLSDGGANNLYIRGYMQTRYYANFRDRDDEGEDTEDEFTHGFQESRVRLRFQGSVYKKNLTYDIQTELSRATGAVLMDSEIRYTFDNKLYLRTGQYKPRFNREEIVSDNVQLVTERSVTNSVFTLGRSQGAGLGWEGSDFNFAADFHEGADTLNREFNSPREADFAVAARGEWKLAGTTFKCFEDFTSWRDSEFSAMIGAAVNFESYGDTGPGPDDANPERDVFGVTVDGSLEGDGWNAFAAALYRNIDQSDDESNDVFGAVAQAGIFVTDQTELFVRYDGVFPDDTLGPDDFHTATVGSNYYISPRSHAVKLTGDVCYFFDPEAASAIIPAPSTSLGLLRDSEGDQFVIRVQIQIIF